MLFIVLTVVAALALALTFIGRAASPQATTGMVGARPALGVLAAAIIGIWLVLTMFTLFTTVSAGHIGLVKAFGNYTSTMEPGWHLKAPWQHVDEADARVQSHRIVMDGQHGRGSAVSKDTQPVYAVVTINYRLSADKILELYTTVGSHYYDILIDPRVPQVFKSKTVEYTTTAIAPNRETIRKATQETLDAQLVNYGIRVTDFLVNDLDFAPEFVAAITEKQVATQRAEAAQAKVAQAKAEAEQAVETAKGEALAIEVKGKALRNNPEILRLTAIEKLNPNVQTIYVPNGQTFLFNLPQAQAGQK